MRRTWFMKGKWSIISSDGSWRHPGRHTSYFVMISPSDDCRLKIARKAAKAISVMMGHRIYIAPIFFIASESDSHSHLVLVASEGH
jgi:hypothetical protein